MKDIQWIEESLEDLLKNVKHNDDDDDDENDDDEESIDEDFDSSKPCYFPFVPSPNPPFPLPWWEKKWLEWLETPIAKAPGLKTVTWADQSKKDPKKYLYFCGPLKSCLKTTTNATVNRFAEPHSAKPVFHNPWREYVRNLQSMPPNPAGATSGTFSADPQVKRVHWPDRVSLHHHLYSRPVEHRSWRERLNLIQSCRRDLQEVQQIRAELLVKPGPGSMTRAGSWIKARILRLPNRPPAASPLKSCLKASTPKEESYPTALYVQTPGPSGMSSTKHISSCEITRGCSAEIEMQPLLRHP